MMATLCQGSWSIGIPETFLPIFELEECLAHYLSGETLEYYRIFDKIAESPFLYA